MLVSAKLQGNTCCSHMLPVTCLATLHCLFAFRTHAMGNFGRFSASCCRNANTWQVLLNGVPGLFDVCRCGALLSAGTESQSRRPCIETGAATLTSLFIVERLTVNAALQTFTSGAEPEQCCCRTMFCRAVCTVRKQLNTSVTRMQLPLSSQNVPPHPLVHFAVPCMCFASRRQPTTSYHLTHLHLSVSAHVCRAFGTL